MNSQKGVGFYMKEQLLHYRCIPCSKMTEEEVSQASELFSNNYGVWSQNLDASYAGKQIRFGPGKIKRDFISKPDRYIAMAYCEKKLVGHAFYLKRELNGKVIVWILQLVVDKDYRNNRIGQKLMYSIWGMSNRWAWGLYTSNPSTIRALEYATMRKVDVKKISKHIDEIRSIAYDIFDSTEWIDNYADGIVNTNFYVSHEDISRKLGKYFNTIPFGLPRNLPEGCEWLAFVFHEQAPYATEEQLKTMLEYSDEVIKNAYQGMLMEKHGWAQHTLNEVDFLYRHLKFPKSLLDVGCGRGRHVIEFAKKGIKAHGIDFVEEHINMAKEHAIPNALFTVEDARKMKTRRKYDSAICLYDVVGSFAKEIDNLQILNEIYHHLHIRGRLAISVMNMDLTMLNCTNNRNVVYGIKSKIKKLIQLRGSNTMQNSGDVFDGSKIIVDATTGICYRKEEFDSHDDALPIEYVVTDRRYTLEGIGRLLKRAGFIVEKSSFVSAKDWNKSLGRYDPHAKEILVIARKGSLLYKLWNRNIDINNCWK